MPHTMVRHGDGGLGGALKRVGGTLAGRGAPGISRLGQPDAGIRAHGCRWWATPCRTTIVRAPSCRSAGIDKGLGGGPETHDDVHGCATGRTAGRERLRGLALCRLVIAGVCLRNHQADGRGRDGAAGMEQAKMTDFHEAIGQDVLEEPAEKLHDVEMGGAWACTPRFTVGEGDRAVLERDDAAGGDGDPEDIRSEVGEGRVSVVIGLTVDVPGDVPDLWVDVR